MKPRANLFIVGVAKSGTTSLHGYLSQHPQLFMTTPKEPFFFGSDFPEKRRVVKSLRNYEGLFPEDYLKYRYRGESTAGYVLSIDAAEMIYEYNPDARIIAVFRNPADMIFSAHSEFLYSRNETVKDFCEAWKLSSVRKKGKCIPRTCVSPKNLVYTELAAYATQIKRFMNVFPRDQIFLGLYDDFAADTQGFLNHLFQFLGIEPNFSFDLSVQNKRKRAHFPYLAHLLYGKSPAFNALKGFINRLGIKRTGISHLLQQFNTTKAKKNILDENLRKEILDHYRDEIEELESLLHRKLDMWN